jgi:pyruvate/2-oxoglutarate/acetoin dehydrogenase E1 component
VSAYFDELCEAMRRLSERPDVVFVGQGVECAGTTMTDTLKRVPREKLLEFPVAEDLQMGFCIGMALEGWLPVCIFPRWNFLLCAANQIVNHLDRLPIYSEGGYNPRVIIRVAVPVTDPFNPGPQHDDDFTSAFRRMLRKVKLLVLPNADDIGPAYAWAARNEGASLLVEYTGLYGAIPSGVPEREAENA